MLGLIAVCHLIREIFSLHVIVNTSAFGGQHLNGFVVTDSDMQRLRTERRACCGLHRWVTVEIFFCGSDYDFKYPELPMKVTFPTFALNKMTVNNS